MVDKIENIHGSIVQHGPHNDRIYVLHLAPEQTGFLLPELEQIALKQGYGKIFALVPTGSWHDFQAAGYVKEAEVPFFFDGRTGCSFVAKFFGHRHHSDEDFTNLFSLIDQNDAKREWDGETGRKYTAELCSPSDAEELSQFYRQVFRSYPFPIFDTQYLMEVLKEKVSCYCIRIEKKLVAAAAIEWGTAGKYVEMTDFATLPGWRCRGLAECILAHMDKVVREDGIKTAFTTARATSFGMNKVFRKRGYVYSGLLVNNTQIDGRIQSMAVWHKHFGNSKQNRTGAFQTLNVLPCTISEKKQSESCSFF